MEVILLDRILNLGDIGDTVTVKPGYGRNYLLPQGKALRATEANRAVYEERKAELMKKVAESQAAAKAKADQLAAIGSITLTALASEEGKLYGSIGAREIAEAIDAAGVQVDTDMISLPDGPIREVGEAEALIQLYAEVEQTIQVVVKTEGDDEGDDD